MKIGRRNLLWATAGLAMTKFVGPTSSPANLAGSDEFPWHPFTRSLLDRARQTCLVDGRANTALIERLIRQETVTQGYANPPVIKWLANPFEAFAHLSELSLDKLLRLGNAQLWRRAVPAVDMDEDRLNSTAVLGSRIAGLVRSAEHDEALMAPKLLAKARVVTENASLEVIFKVRAVPAQIGWLETCIPVVAAQAVTDIELLLSSGVSEETIHHQLNVFEVYELGWDCSLRGKRRASSYACLDRSPSRSRATRLTISEMRSRGTDACAGRSSVFIGRMFWLH